MMRYENRRYLRERICDASRPISTSARAKSSGIGVQFTPLRTILEEIVKPTLRRAYLHEGSQIDGDASTDDQKLDAKLDIPEYFHLLWTKEHVNGQIIGSVSQS